MQKMNTDTLAGNLAVPSLEYDGYASFFSGLLEVTHTRAVDDGLGERIEEYVMSWLGDHALDGFDDYSADGYRRTYLEMSLLQMMCLPSFIASVPRFLPSGIVRTR